MSAFVDNAKQHFSFAQHSSVAFYSTKITQQHAWFHASSAGAFRAEEQTPSHDHITTKYKSERIRSRQHSSEHTPRQ